MQLKVSIIIYGKDPAIVTPKILLKNSLTNANPFERGSTDLFKIATIDVGEIEKINISHDGKGSPLVRSLERFSFYHTVSCAYLNF
jgi:hypothetical protein